MGASGMGLLGSGRAPRTLATEPAAAPPALRRLRPAADRTAAQLTSTMAAAIEESRVRPQPGGSDAGPGRSR
ncbi:hypothetical protein GCM10009714_29120 [Microlunatus capsulatus]